MAYYINDIEVIKDCSTSEGVEIIKNKILEWDKSINIEIRHKGTSDEVILIQGIMETGYTNYVGIGLLQIYVNPISNKDGDFSASSELRDFIQFDVKRILRDKRLSLVLPVE